MASLRSSCNAHSFTEDNFRLKDFPLGLPGGPANLGLCTSKAGVVGWITGQGDQIPYAMESFQEKQKDFPQLPLQRHLENVK